MSEDVVNHPNHYTQYNGFEVIDVCEQLRAPDGTGNFNRGNAFKYLARAGWKNPEKHLEDLQKAEFYIKREIERVKNQALTTAFDEGVLTVGQLRAELLKNEPPVIDYCPDCGIRLMADNSCPNDHGWLKVSAHGKTWMAPSVSRSSLLAHPDVKVRALCTDQDCYNPYHESGHEASVDLSDLAFQQMTAPQIEEVIG